MATARPATVALLLAVLAAAHGCGGDDATGTMVVIEPEVGLVMPMDQLRVVAVGRDASDAPHAAERTYPIAGTGTTWPQSIVVLAGLKASAGVEVLVIGLKDAVEVARGGAVVTFAPGAIVTATVTLRAACRGVYCAERSFCGADGQCPPAVRRLDFAVNASGRHDQTSPTVASLGASGWVMAWANEAVDPAQVYLRRFASDGAPRDARDHQVAPSSRRQGAPVLAAAPGADAFVVGWAEADAGRVMVRRFDASGQPLGAADEPAGAGGGSQGAPTLGANPAGFVVAWQDTESPTGAGTSVRFRRGAWQAGWLDPAVAYAATDPRSAEQRPTACGSCGGGETFLVAWQDTRR